MAWAHYDVKALESCIEPLREEDQVLLGSVFLTREAFLISEFEDNKGSYYSEYPRSAVLLAHELVHALSQKGHPSGEKPGNLMADYVSDIGEKILPEQCACILQSPWVSRIAD